MTPTDKAAKVHGAISVLRGQRDAVEQHARHLASGHTLMLPSAAPDALEPIEAASPAEVSDRLLRALFGNWPPRS